jgi:hypothetical protein
MSSTNATGRPDQRQITTRSTFSCTFSPIHSHPLTKSNRSSCLNQHLLFAHQTSPASHGRPLHRTSLGITMRKSPRPRRPSAKKRAGHSGNASLAKIPPTTTTSRLLPSWMNWKRPRTRCVLSLAYHRAVNRDSPQAIEERSRRQENQVTIDELKKSQRVNVKIQPMYIFLLRDGKAFPSPIWGCPCLHHG